MVDISKHNDIKVGFAFALEDADGKQIQLSDTLTFKCALEPGMINSIVRRIEGTLKELGQDYFMTLVRDYISKKQEEIYKAEALKSYNSIYTQEDSKIVASGVRDIIGDSFEQTANDNNTLTADEMPVE